MSTDFERAFLANPRRLPILKPTEAERALKIVGDDYERRENRSETSELLRLCVDRLEQLAKANDILAQHLNLALARIAALESSELNAIKMQAG